MKHDDRQTEMLTWEAWPAIAIAIGLGLIVAHLITKCGP